MEGLDHNGLLHSLKCTHCTACIKNCAYLKMTISCSEAFWNTAKGKSFSSHWSMLVAAASMSELGIGRSKVILSGHLIYIRNITPPNSKVLVQRVNPFQFRASCTYTCSMTQQFPYMVVRCGSWSSRCQVRGTFVGYTLNNHMLCNWYMCTSSDEDKVLTETLLATTGR